MCARYAKLQGKVHQTGVSLGLVTGVWFILGDRHTALTLHSHISLSNFVSSVWMLHISTYRLPTIPARNAEI